MDSFTISEGVQHHLVGSFPNRPREIELPSLSAFASLLGLRGYELDEDSGSGSEVKFPCLQEPSWMTTRLNCIFCSHEQSCSSLSGKRDSKITTAIHLYDQTIHFLDQHFNKESVHRNLTNVFPTFDVFCEPHSQPTSRVLMALPLSTQRVHPQRTASFHHLYYSEVFNRSLTLFEATLFHFVEDLVFQTRLKDDSVVHLNDIIDSGCLSIHGWKEGLKPNSSFAEQCSAMVGKILGVFKSTSAERHKIYTSILNQFLRDYGRKYEEGSLTYYSEFDYPSTGPLELVEYLFAYINHVAESLTDESLAETKLFDARVDVILLNNSNEHIPLIHPIFRVIRQFSFENMPKPVLLLKDSSFRAIKKEFYQETIHSMPEVVKAKTPLSVLTHDVSEYRRALAVIAAAADKISFGFSLEDYSTVLGDGLSSPHFAILPSSDIHSVSVLQKFLLKLISNQDDVNSENLKLRLRDVFQNQIQLFGDTFRNQSSFKPEKYQEVLNHFLGSSEFIFNEEGQILEALSDFCNGIPLNLGNGKTHKLFEYEEIITDQNHTLRALTWQLPFPNSVTPHSVSPLKLLRVEDSNSHGEDAGTGMVAKFVFQGELVESLFNSNERDKAIEGLYHSLTKLEQELNSTVKRLERDTTIGLVGAIFLSPKVIKSLNCANGFKFAIQLLDLVKDACHHATLVVGAREEMVEFHALGVASHMIHQIIGSDFSYFRVLPSYDIGGNLFHGTNSISI